MLSKELKISLDELVDNKLDIVCKDNSNTSILNNLIGKICKLKLDDYCFDFNITYDTTIKILDVNDDFIKIEYKKNKEICHKLIDINLIVSIKVMED